MMTEKATQELLNLELKISKFLRMGVIVSGLFMIVGWIFESLKSENSFDKIKSYNPDALADSFQLAYASGDWATVLTYIGLIILVSLPIIRVLLTAVLFIKQKDTPMAALAIFVFFILMTSLMLGFEL